ncbi:MAG TPA: redoxin domain-containing protein [Candidatus Binatia bacterium]
MNCRNTVPQLRAWHAKYAAEGFKVIGVHTPEFFWEKSSARVAAAVKELDIKYPVVIDNNSEMWNRFGVRAWPTIMLIDRSGKYRYLRIGEGGYETTESWIRRLLAEKN